MHLFLQLRVTLYFCQVSISVSLPTPMHQKLVEEEKFSKVCDQFFFSLVHNPYNAKYSIFKDKYASIFFTCKRQLNCVYGLQKWNTKKRKIARWSDDNLFQIAQNNLSTLHWPRCSRNWVRNCLRESKFISKENPHIRWYCLGADLLKPDWALVITKNHKKWHKNLFSII